MTKLENLNTTLLVPGLNPRFLSFVPTFSNLSQISYNADKEKTKVSQFEKFNNFLENSPWGSTINAGINIAGSLIKLPPGYSGKHGALLYGLDETYNAISKGIRNIPVYGLAASLIMDAAGVLNKGIQRLGGGTDGMTKTDAILSSNFLGLTPLGLINGFGGKKANSYTRNQELDAASGAGFGGFQSLQNTTQIGAGKKYGLFSSGARHKLDKLTEYTQGVKHSISGIVDTNTLNNLASQTSSPYATAQFLMDLNGGMLNLRAARKGMKFPIIKLPKFKLKFYDPFKATLGEDWEEMYDADGIRTAIPSTLSTAQKQGLAPIPTKRGGIVYMKADGSFSSTPLYNSLYAKNGGQFVKNVISKYQAGNNLRRSVQVFDVATNKYVLVEIPLNKDLIAGRLPIRLTNGTVVFMNGDGTVTSDRWETLGKREHLTPKGKNGTEIKRKPREMNVIPEGALHARKNHLTEIDDMYKLVTHKGIPVITIEDGGEVVLHAEVEHSEIIFTKEVTDKMESYRKQGTDEAAIECGKMLVKEILYNTDDRSGVIQTVE